MAEERARQEPLAQVRIAEGLRGRNGFLLGALTAGHAVIHWYQQAFWVWLPKMAADLGLGPVQVGMLTTTRFLLQAAANLPGGVITDLLRRQWGAILAFSMGGIGLAYLLTGFSHSLPVLVLTLGLMGITGTLWHLPSNASLSIRFPKRRGFALSTHNFGGNSGDVVAPIAMGFILVLMTWREALPVVAIPALLLSGLVWWSMRGIAPATEGEAKRGEFTRALRGLVRNRALLGVVLLSGLQAMSRNAFLTFFPLHLEQNLAFSSPKIGFHITLLTLLGLFGTPALGMLSDRLGRAAIVVPCLLLLSAASFVVIPAGASLLLTVATAAMGLVFYGIQAVLLASAMDLAGRGVEATTVGILFGGNFLLSSASPVLAGALVSAFGMQAAFLFIGALYAASAAMALVLLPRRPRASSPA